MPVMVDEVLEALQVAPGGRYCDGTVGGAGHAVALLDRSAPNGQLVGLDRDPQAVRRSRAAVASFGERVTISQGNFADTVEILSELGFLPVDGLLLDLGISSYQLESAERGFSFSVEGPVDMRMDSETGPTAAEMVAHLSEEKLAKIIKEYGEERASKGIARAIKRCQQAGRLQGTLDLARAVTKVVGHRSRRVRIHPATRTFMALRMAVNDELGSLHRFLETFTEALRPGGRVAIISFHSLEDRAVKERFAQLANPCTCPPGLPICGCGREPQLSVVTGRPLRPRQEETAANPRARSARLRVAERLG
jgi:16S rRNA (cytosine1402-N4)-methyltransferase